MSIDPRNLAATAKLTFQDNFDTLSLRTGGVGTWATKHPWASPSGSSLNDEQEWYVTHTYVPTSSVKPWRVENGILILEAKPADPSIQSQIGGYKFTSGMITSFDSFQQQFGYFEMRAQLPKGQGFWPAFWLMPSNGDRYVELDIMEMVDKKCLNYFSTVHRGPWPDNVSFNPQTVDLSVGFHNYGMDWQADYIVFYFDGVETGRVETPVGAKKPMYIIANLALGGGWPGNVDNTTPFPAQMKIDHIRVYAALEPGAPPPPPPTPPTPPTPPPGTGTVLRGDNTYGQKLEGTAGNDTFYVGKGSAIMTGNGGANKYVVELIPWNPGRITDFKVGTDHIDITPLGPGVTTIETRTLGGISGSMIYLKRPTDQWANAIVFLEGIPPDGLTMEPPPPTTVKLPRRR